MAKQKVMIVDDSDTTRDYVHAHLTAAGFDVVALGTGLAITAAVWQEKPDLILLDVEMSLRGGDEVTRVLKQSSLLRGPIVLFSAKPEAELRAIAAACGADGYIVKGRDKNVFVASVRRWLTRKSPANAPSTGIPGG